MFAVRFLALCALPLLAFGVSSDELSFAQIAEYNRGTIGQQNTTGQFTVTLTREAYDTTPAVTGQPLVCKNMVENACYNFSNPVQTQPFRVLENEFMIMTAKYKWGAAPLKTYQGLIPTQYQMKVCYSMYSATDRKWRKKNKAYPGITQNCPFDTDKITLPSDISTLVANFSFTDQDLMPTATFFVMLWVYCENDEVCAFDTTEGTNFIQTEVYEAITSQMKIVSAVMSAFAFFGFIGFFVFDGFYFKKTGKGFYF